jgi:hypothetical protein
MAGTMLEYTVLIPLFDNTGVAFAAELLAALRLELIEIFGGCTRQDGLIGAWLQDGVLYEDIVASFTVATARRDGRAVIEKFAQRWGRQLGQLAMYVRLPGGKPIILPIIDG